MNYRYRSFFVVAVFMAFLFLPATKLAGFWWDPDITKGQLDGICEARGGISSPGPLYVDGYYQPSSGPLFGFEEVVRRLGKGRFQFFEMDSSWVHRSHTWGAFDLRKIQGKGRYTRFYMAERGDSNCEAYEGYLRRKTGLAKKKAYLRAYGIYPRHCIAAVNTDELRSEYGIGLRQMQDPDIPEVSWNIDEIKNMSTGEQYASFSSFYFCIKGKKKNGKCRGDREDSYRCPSTEVRKTENFKSIYYQTFKSTPNPILEKKLTVEEIREPVTVPVERVTPELIEVVEGKENIPKLYADEVMDLYNKGKDAEGYAWFDSRTITFADGSQGHLGQPQLFLINEIKRQLLQIDINVEIPEERYAQEYCCIRSLPDDGVYFIAKPTRMEYHEKANNFKILKYSWEGKLERVVAGTLPFDFVTNKEHLHYYAKLQIRKSQYLFSVLDVMRKDDIDPIHPSIEYKFRVSLTGETRR